MPIQNWKHIYELHIGTEEGISRQEVGMNPAKDVQSAIAGGTFGYVYMKCEYIYIVVNIIEKLK